MTDAQRAELEQALEHVDPDVDNNDWVKIGQGIHHSYPGPDGLQVFEQWSAGCAHRHDDGECETRWASFSKSDDPSKDVTLASVFHNARENGWTGTSAAAAFADAPVPGSSYTEQQSEAAAHGNPVAAAQEAIMQPASFIEMMTMNDVIRAGHAMPPAKRLFDDLVFEGEIKVIFSRMGVGKTALGIQIAASIASGISIPGFAFEATEGEKVLYWDFELSKKQISMRYDKPVFHDNLLRCSINPDKPVPVNNNHSAIMLAAIEESVKQSGVKKLVIDNLTYMGEDLADGGEALLLMKRLKDLKTQFGLTMIIAAHTPKIEPFKAISMNNLAGSSNIGNFIDSCSAIGEVKGMDNFRYIKQLKVRSAEKKYGAGNVILCEMSKIDGMLGFIHHGFGTEEDLIKGRGSNDGEISMSNQRREFIKVVMGPMLELDKVVTMRTLAKKITDKSIENVTTRSLFNDGSKDRAYKVMIKMFGGEGSVWYDVGDRRQVEFFNDSKRLSHIKNCRSKYGVRMVKDGL